MSAPSLDTSDSETGSFRVPVVSCKTAFFCLDRVCGADAIRAQIKPNLDEHDIEQGVLPVDRLVAMARKSGLQVREAHFDWRALLIATATNPALLLLRNGNVITVLGTGREGVEEVIVSDPLYQNGEPFFLPRVALEHAWAGEALIVQPKRGRTERALAWYLSILSLCGVAAALLLMFQSTIGVMLAGAPIWHEHAATTASNEALNARAQEAPALPAAAAGVTDRSDPPTRDIGSDARASQRGAAPPADDTATVLVGTAQQTEQPGAPVEDGASRSPDPAGNAAPEPPSSPPAPPPDQIAALPTPSPPTQQPAPPAAAPVPTPSLPAEEIAALITRGDALIIKGDVASARLFYERAADAADGQAALRLGESYDPAFLERAHLTGARGDVQTAARWYRRARELGASEAEALLRTLSPQ